MIAVTLMRVAVHAVKRAFERKGLTTPRSNSVWSQPFLRSFVLDDVYKPHTSEEMAALVSPEVLARLDPRRCYGVWWYNKYRFKVVTNVKTPNGYRVKHTYEEKARQEWVAVPVPDAEVPREWVEAAREAIKDSLAFVGGATLLRTLRRHPVLHRVRA